MILDIFEETRRRVSAREAAERYGFQPNRAGFIPCPLHHEKTASMKLYPDDGGFYCFGCHTGGSVIDFVGKLLDLSPLDAVKRLNEDFHLCLELDKPPDKAEMQEAQRRREIGDTYRLFKEWRDGLIQQLNDCFREGYLALKSLTSPEDFDRLTDAQALAIREQAYIEWLADILTSGTMVEKMEVFRQREGVTAICEKILSRS